MYLDLSNQKIPKIYRRRSKDCYLDPIRKKLVDITPEEEVRQKMISYLVDTLAVPPEMIRVEMHLSNYGISSRHRADIVIHAMDDDQLLHPVAVIECKASHVVLGESAAQQVVDYCNEIGCDYAMLVNGIESFCYHYNDSRNEYEQITCLPRYSELLENRYHLFDPGEFPERTPFENITDFLMENRNEISDDISHLTEEHLACAAFNLMECLLDSRHKLPLIKNELYQVIEDYGVRILSYGNASGGVFSGPYRSFILDVNGSHEIVSLGFTTYYTYSRPDMVKTCLCVAIDHDDESHHALQLVLDNNVVRLGNRFRFYHNGRIAVGNKGSGKISELHRFVRERRPELIYGEQFYLGSLVYDRNWDLDDPEVARLIENLIAYALIRDEYRAYVKSIR